MGARKRTSSATAGESPVSHASEDALLVLPPLARVLSFPFCRAFQLRICVCDPDLLRLLRI